MIADASVTFRLDAAGEWRARVPLTDPRTDVLQVGRIWREYRQAEGFVFAGLIESITRTPEDMLELRGPTLLAELLYRNTLLARGFSDQTVNAIVDSLLASTGWTRNGSDTTLLSIRYDGESLLRALLAALETVGSHLREQVDENIGGTLVRTLGVGAFGAHSGVTIMGGRLDNVVLTDPALAHIEKISIEEVNKEVWNWVVPLGAGEGVAQLTLEHQDLLPNVLANPSFEDDLDSWAVVGTTNATIASDRSIHSHKSMRITGVGGFDSLIYQQVSTTPGEVWRFEAWAFPLSGAGTVQLNVGVFNAGSGVILNPVMSNVGSGTWERLASGEITMPAGAAFIRVHCFVLAGGGNGGYFDLIRMWHPASVSGESYDIFTEVTTPAELLAQVNWYITDAASVTANGRRARVFVAKDIAPLAETGAALTSVANSLYRLAVAQLVWWRAVQFVYKLSAVALDPSVLPGDLVRVRWKGTAQHYAEEYVYLDVDDDLWVLERQRQFSNDGSEVSQLMVSTIDRRQQTGTEVVIGKLEDTSRAFRTHVQTSLTHYDNGPFVDELDAAHPMEVRLHIHDNTIQLLHSKVHFRGRPIRSPVDVVDASGGSAPTSSGGSSHSHSISGQTAASGGSAGATSSTHGSHRHVMFNYIQDGGVAETRRLFDANAAVKVFLEISSPSSPETYEAAGGHTHSVPISAHSHTVTGTTSSAESSHTHSVTIAAHGHNLVFGIFEGSSPADIQLWIDGVNRTTPLGGPWAAAGAEVDITNYFLDGDGMVVHGDHTLEFRVPSGLGRVEAHVHWINIIAPLRVTS